MDWNVKRSFSGLQYREEKKEICLSLAGCSSNATFAAYQKFYFSNLAITQAPEPLQCNIIF